MTAHHSIEIPDVNGLTLDQKLGQMLLLGFRGTKLADDNPILNDIREYRVGGVILFSYDVVRKSYDRNIASPEQVFRLTGDLRSRSEIPLFICIDQEGGTVNRLHPDFGFPPTKSHREIGEMNDPASTYLFAREIAELVRSTGHNFNLAPCVDLSLNRENKAIYGRDRCFSEDPEVVSLHASAYIRAHRDAGVLTAAKHFPGHGSSREDTHLGMADVTESWQEFELLPYQRIMEEGFCDAIITSHIFHRMLDPDRPATLSCNIVSGLLRERMGYHGVVITDDLQMKAISEHFGKIAAMRLALTAGVDVLLFGNNMEFDPDVSVRFNRVVREMLDQGEITGDRIDASVERILRLKKQIAQQVQDATGK